VLLIPTLVLSFFVPEYQKILRSLQEEEERKEELKRLPITRELQDERRQPNQSDRKGSKDSTHSLSSRKESLMLSVEEQPTSIVILPPSPNESVRYPLTSSTIGESHLQVTGHNAPTSPKQQQQQFNFFQSLGGGSSMRSLVGTTQGAGRGSQGMLQVRDEDSSFLSDDSSHQSLKRSLSARVTSGDASLIRRSLREKRTSIATTAFNSNTQTTFFVDTSGTSNLQPHLIPRHGISTSPVAPRSPTSPFAFQPQAGHHRHHQLPPIPPQGPTMMSSHGDIHSMTSASFQRQNPQRRSLYQQQLLFAGQHQPNPHTLQTQRIVPEYSTEVHQSPQGSQLTILTRPRSSSCFISGDYQQDHRFAPSNV